MDRAEEINRLLFSQDEDLLIEAAERQRNGVPFSGLVYCPQLALSIGQVIDDLEIVAKAGLPSDFANSVQYLPLRCGWADLISITSKLRQHQET